MELVDEQAIKINSANRCNEIDFRFGWFWLDLVGFGRVWSDLVGFGWVWLDLVGFGRI